MSPCKTVAKHPCYSPDSFKNEDAYNVYIDYYKNAVIIMERGVDLESLENTFILEVFKEITWTKLLNPSGDVYECIVKEFFALHLWKMTISTAGFGGKSSPYPWS